MKRMYTHPTLLSFLVAVALGSGCGDSAPPTDIAPPTDAAPPTDSGTPSRTLPAVPEPSSLSDLLPAESETLIVGLSAELPTFYPQVNQLEMMQDDGSLEWTSMNSRRVGLACSACLDCLPRITGQPGAANATYISARPRLLHARHWRLLKQNTLSPGTSFEFKQIVTWGTSTTNERSVSFSETLGVAAEIGGAWSGLSGAISASYSQTTTATEVNSVTFTEETSEERTYTVQAPASGTRVFGLWQLVDEFAMVDANQVPIDQSPTLVHVRMPPVPKIQFPSDDVVAQKTTDFK